MVLVFLPDIMEVLMLQAEVWGLSQKEKLFHVFQLWVKQATFVMEHHFYFEKQQKDKSWLFRLGYLADIVLEINRVSPLFQGKQLIFFFCYD